MNTKAARMLDVLIIENKISVFFSKRNDGNMSLNWGNHADVNKNVKNFFQKAGVGLRKKRVHIKTGHGNRVLILNKKNIDVTRVKGLKHDGVITSCRKAVLTLASADCYPVVMTDKAGSFVSLLHVGRSGAEKKIVSKAIGIVIRRIGVRPKDIILVVGPGIEECCYSVDLFKMIKQQAISYCVSHKNIHTTNVCTCCKKGDNGEHLFFSHRRSMKNGELEGRFLTVVSFK